MNKGVGKMLLFTVGGVAIAILVLLAIRSGTGAPLSQVENCNWEPVESIHGSGPITSFDQLREEAGETATDEELRDAGFEIRDGAVVACYLAESFS
jgi:hypothetical protein